MFGGFLEIVFFCYIIMVMLIVVLIILNVIILVMCSLFMMFVIWEVIKLRLWWKILNGKWEVIKFGVLVMFVVIGIVLLFYMVCNSRSV